MGKGRQENPDGSVQVLQEGPPRHQPHGGEDGLHGEHLSRRGAPEDRGPGRPLFREPGDMRREHLRPSGGQGLLPEVRFGFDR